MTALERITEWAELADAATEGPWNYGTPPEDDPADTATYLTGFAIDPTAPCTAVWVVWTPSDTGIIAPAITGDGPTSGPNAAHIAASRTAVPVMAAALTAVLKRHQPIAIYDECECTDEQKQIGHEDIYEVGTTCNLLYVICDECCRVDVYQTEDCATYHDHKPGEAVCPTVEVIETALVVTP